MGETIWAVVRAMLYSAAYLLVIAALGLVESPWAILALPACFVIGFGFAGAGIAAVTWMRTWKDFDLIQLVMLPMFMFSATFYPITVYPTVLEWIVRCLPLYHGIELIRSLTTGTVGPFQLVNVAYLTAMGLVGPLPLLAAHRQAAPEVARPTGRARRRSGAGRPRRPHARRN